MTIKYILEQIRNRGFIEAGTITELANCLGASRTLLNFTIQKIEFFQENYDLPKPEKNDYHNFFIHKINHTKKNPKNRIIICFRASDKFKEIMGIKKTS